jgi:pimeloyl-ACP methyl ester carboxylesterase
METVTTHAATVLREIVGRPAHVVGHSRGGAVAARLAIEHPDMVRTLTVVDSGSMAPLDPAVPVGRFYSSFERMIDVGGAEGVRAEPDAQAIDPSWITDDFVARMVAIANRPETESIRARFAAAELEFWRPSLERSRSDTLRRIDTAGLPVPVLVLWGYADRSAPRHLGHRLFERIAAKTDVAAFGMVNHAGHYLFRDRPRWFASELTAFWGSVDE